MFSQHIHRGRIACHVRIDESEAWRGLPHEGLRLPRSSELSARGRGKLIHVWHAFNGRVGSAGGGLRGRRAASAPAAVDAIYAAVSKLRCATVRSWLSRGIHA